METLVKQTSTENANEDIKNWFDRFLSHINVDKMMMETQTAPAATKALYSDFIYERHDEINSRARSTSTMFFLQKLTVDYLEELSKYEVKPQRLAFDLSDAKILVWAQIIDEDEATEDALILAEAKANAKYSDNGFYVSTTIVEESDCVGVPPHYHEIKLT